MAVLFLLDIDAFFAQAEQVKRPELRGRKVIVGGHVTERGVVASSSYEARACGVKTAMPISQAARICPDGVFLPGDFETYGRMSRQVRDICLRYTPLVEMVSSDEGFLDMSGCGRHWGAAAEKPSDTANGPTSPRNWPLDAAAALQRDVRSEVGLWVTIGVGPNRLVAKVASDFAKPRGVLSVLPGREAAFLSTLPVKVLPGVGPKTAEHLQRFNLRTVGDVAAMGVASLGKWFGEAAGEHLWSASQGLASSEVCDSGSGTRSISRETTFARDKRDRGELVATLSWLLQRSCRQLRREELLAATITLKLRYADFRTVSRSRTLADATDHDDAFYPELLRMLPGVCGRGEAVRLIGVALTGLRATGQQMTLFDEAEHSRRSRLYGAIDAVRERFGFGAVTTSEALDLIGDD